MRRFLGFIALAALLMGACSSSDSTPSATGTGAPSTTAQPNTGGTLRFAIDTEPERLNPILSDLDPISDQLLFNGLTRYGKDFVPEPDLAERWEISADGLVYTFFLRDAVTWHDGTPFTAEDVKFTYDAITGPDVTPGKKFFYNEVASTEVVNPLTVRITLKNPINAFLGRASLGIAPKHLLQGKNLNEDGFNQNPVGTGPFKFVQWRPGEFVELDRNPAYHRGPAKLDKIIVSFVEDATARAVQLQADEIDGAWLPPVLASQFEGADDVTLYLWKSHDGRDITLNFYANSLFADKRVRQALNVAIDREAVLDSVFKGKGVVGWSPFHRTAFEAAAGEPVVRDLARAAQLMTDAGWVRNGDGIWEKDGATFTFAITGPSTEPSRLDNAQVVATSLREAGFDVTVDGREWSYILDPANLEEIDAFSFGWGYYSNDPDEGIWIQYHSSQTIKEGNGGFNYGYVRPELDALLEQARTERDTARQGDLYRQIDEFLRDDPAVLFTVFIDQPYAISSRVKGLKETTLAHHAFGLFWNVEEWSIDPS